MTISTADHKTRNPLPYSDFRSDTATAPTADMFKAMMKSSLGDDVYNEDDSVKKLERYVAALCGQEAALFCSSGTMTNQLALRVHLNNPPQSAMVDIRSHVFNYEAGGISFHSQAAVYPVMPSNEKYLTAEDVASKLILDVDVHYAPTRVIALENTLNGTIMPLEEIERIRRLTKEHGVKLHLDGARLWHASMATGISMKEYCSHFDSISLCLSKGIGAPIGSILVGSAAVIKKARHFRLLFGGGWRQAGFLAEAALWGIKNNWPTMEETHRQAKWLERVFVQIGCKMTNPVETNMVWVDTSEAGFTVDELMAELAKEGIKISGSGCAARVVLHYQITDEAVERFIEVLRKMAVSPRMKVSVDLTKAQMRERPQSVYDDVAKLGDEAGVENGHFEEGEVDYGEDGEEEDEEVDDDEDDEEDDDDEEEEEEDGEEEDGQIVHNPPSYLTSPPRPTTGVVTAAAAAAQAARSRQLTASSTGTHQSQLRQQQQQQQQQSNHTTMSSSAAATPSPKSRQVYDEKEVARRHATMGVPNFKQALFKESNSEPMDHLETNGGHGHPHQGQGQGQGHGAAMVAVQLQPNINRRSSSGGGVNGEFGSALGEFHVHRPHRRHSHSHGHSSNSSQHHNNSSGSPATTPNTRRQSCMLYAHTTLSSGALTEEEEVSRLGDEGEEVEDVDMNDELLLHHHHHRRHQQQQQQQLEQQQHQLQHQHQQHTPIQRRRKARQASTAKLQHHRSVGGGGRQIRGSDLNGYRNTVSLDMQELDALRTLRLATASPSSLISSSSSVLLEEGRLRGQVGAAVTAPEDPVSPTTTEHTIVTPERPHTADKEKKGNKSGKLQYRLSNTTASKAIKRASVRIARWSTMLSREA
ncbi:Threonine aldolase [Actinomortierella ambigua]|nr:Threonine aldolase [Actinomortierella ambigua]